MVVISEVCACDLGGEVGVVLRAETHLEAPNWHPDGFLVVNGGGRLWRIPLDAPELLAIDTGPLVRLNNDHGISPDGRTLMVSDHSGGEGSCIWALPVEGLAPGEAPRRISAQTPSWWHGYAPDGARIAYAAARGGRTVLVHDSRADGTDERCLTPGFDHCDGPDYSADGTWLWFNGERDGAVDLWRVNLTDLSLERMTTGPKVDWFPHPSPDGAHVVYLAFPPGTRGHPGGLPVEIRVMSQKGGPPETLVRLHGGQGSLNVPSWSPTGTSFAFVRYPDS